MKTLFASFLALAFLFTASPSLAKPPAKDAGLSKVQKEAVSAFKKESESAITRAENIIKMASEGKLPKEKKKVDTMITGMTGVLGRAKDMKLKLLKDKAVAGSAEFKEASEVHAKAIEKVGEARKAAK
jgi:hypothetical protein